MINLTMVVSEVGSPLSKELKASKYFVEIGLLNSSDSLKQELNKFLTNKLLLLVMNNLCLYFQLSYLHYKMHEYMIIYNLHTVIVNFQRK